MVNPTIPKSEYPQRWRRVQEMMKIRGLDIIVAYADDRAVFGPAHARWMANFPVHFEPVCILFAQTGEPIMLVGPESDEYAMLAGEIPDVRILQEFTHPNEDYPFTKMQSMAEIIADSGFASGKTLRIGVGAQGLIGADLWAAFQDALPDAEWIDAENILCDVRSQKSAAEIAVIRHAYSIAEIGLSAALTTIAPGVTERAVAAEIEGAMRRAGAEGTGIDTIVAAGPNSRPILARSTFNTIQTSDLVLLTIAPRYEGYHAAIGRPVFVGDIAPEVAQALNLATQAQEACFHALKPSIEGRSVEAIGRNIVNAGGLGEHFLYSGVHSLGVIEFEPPIFGPSQSAMIKENMIISVDIPLFNAPWGGLRVENGYLITDTGAEQLHDTPFLLRV